jgi:hypothetical protein
MFARILALGLFVTSAWLNAQAQQKLADLVSEARAEWMFGKWEASTDDGTTVQLTVSWDLEKNVAILHGKYENVEFKGYSAVDPNSSEVKYVGFDNRGVVSKGSWGMENEELVLRYESTTWERGSFKMGAVFTGNPTDGLRLRLYRVDGSGYLASNPELTLKFKKAKS